MGLAVVARYSSMSEAQVACTALRSARLLAVVLDEGFAGILPVETDLLEGIRLCVPEADLSAAQALLAAAREIGDAEARGLD